MRGYAVGMLACVLVAGCTGDTQEETEMGALAGQELRTIRITSDAFADGQRVPDAYTCEGANVSPKLALAAVPGNTSSLAIVMDDPDAPSGTFTHWTAWNLPGTVRTLDEDADIAALGGIEGSTSRGETGYFGPCPPSGVHRYFFRIYALDTTLDLEAGAAVDAVHAAIGGHVLAWGELMGTYSRDGS